MVKLPLLSLITGDEFLRREKIKALLDSLIPEAYRSSNLNRIYPDDFNWAALIAQAGTPSLLGGPQVFWVSQVERMKKEDWSPLERWCQTQAKQDLASRGVLQYAPTYIIFEGEALPKTHALIKLAERFGHYRHLEARAGESNRDLWREKLKRSGKTLTPGAWRVLEERFGGVMRLLDSCLDQLIVYSDAPTIDEQAVENLAVRFLRYEPFDLTDALASKDVPKAILIFRYFFELEGDMPSAIGLLHWQLKRIWQAKKALARGRSPDQVGREIGISPYRLSGFLNQVKRFELATIERFLDELWRLDWDAKTGACEPVIAMETFLAGVR